jgi:hypothetical protein
MSKEEQIRSAINNLDDSTAKDALALLLSGGATTPKTTSQSDGLSDKQFSNFAQAINWLKSKYKFQELSVFSTEADLVYVNTGDRKVLITDTTVKPREIQRPVADETLLNNSETDFENKNDMDNAFEPMQKNDRFSNLEL